MTPKFKNGLLWATAKENGGSFTIDKKYADLARTGKAYVMLEMNEDSLTVTAIDDDQVVVWPEDEKRIDIIGQNGNDGDHYHDE